MIVDSKDLPYTVICSSDNFSILSHFLTSFFFLLVYSPCRFRFCFVLFFLLSLFLLYVLLKETRRVKKGQGLKQKSRIRDLQSLYAEPIITSVVVLVPGKEMYNKSHETRLMKVSEIIRKDSGVLKN